MTVEEYLEVLQTERPTIVHNRMLKHLPFPINPENDFLGIKEIQEFKKDPYGIEEGEDYLKVYYPDGQVEYSSKDGALLPKSIIIYGPLSQERLDTEIHFNQVNEKDIKPLKDHLYYNDICLEIEVHKPEEEEFKEWCMPENRR